MAYTARIESRRDPVNILLNGRDRSLESVGLLQEIDIVLAPFSITRERRRVMDFTFPFLTEDEIWSVIIFLYEQTGWSPRTWEEEGAEGGEH